MSTILKVFCAALAGLALAVPPSGAVGQSKTADVVPVMLDFGEYVPANDKIMDFIGDELRKSRILVQNVDAPRALVIRARFIPARSNERRIDTAYIWGHRPLARATYSCPTTRLRQCAFAIVKGAERAVRSKRFR